MSEVTAHPSSNTSPCILVLNFHSAQNAGDLALLEMNLCQLRAGFHQPSFIITANYPQEPPLAQIPDARVIPSANVITGANLGAPLFKQIFRLLIGVIKAIFSRYFGNQDPSPAARSGWDELIGAFKQADLVVSVSGNYLLSMGRYGWPFPLTVFPIWAAHLFKKPFYALPQSIGPFKRGWEKFIFRQLYGRARRVFLRDQVSMELASALGLPAGRVQFAPDPAFALPAASPEEARQIIMKYGYQPGQDAVGVTVIAGLSRVLSQSDIEQYYRDLAAVLYRFGEQYGTRVYIFNQVTGPTVREDDRHAGRNLLDLLPAGQSRVVLVDEVLSPGQLKACYGCMDLMLASRLHSGIFAMGAGVATVSIGYFTKSRGLMQAMGLEEWLVELGKADAEVMWQKFSAAWEQRAKIAQMVQKKVASFEQHILDVGPQISADYEHHLPRPRVVQLIKGLDIGGYNGGSDIFGANLARALIESGTEAHLVVFFQMGTPAEQQFVEQLSGHAVKVIFLQPWHGSTSFRTYLNGLKKLTAYVKAERIDLVHSHFHVGTLIAAWLRLTGRVSRAARTIHVDREWQRGWEGPVQQALIRSFIFVLFPLLIDLECGVSKASIDVLNSRWLVRLTGKKARLIYNAIPSPDYSSLQQMVESTGRPKTEGQFVIGTVGRMTEQKGHEFLLSAIPAVHSEIPEARFCWVGDGPLRAALEEQAVHSGVRELIHFTGLRSDVPALLDQMDLFVLPSIYEGLPTVVLESMARGVPVIATDIPGTREIIQHQRNGWLVPPRSPEKLAEAIISAVRSPQERVRVARVAVLSLQEFTIERVAEKYLALYQGLFK